MPLHSLSVRFCLVPRLLNAGLAQGRQRLPMTVGALAAPTRPAMATARDWAVAQAMPPSLVVW
ncbi:hypothetical protein D3C87_1833000 [compost metagenome]